MNEPFVITVSYLGREHEFIARFERWDYTHRIAVLIGETTFNFEPDEEGGYRAIVHPELAVAVDFPDPGLLHSIAEKLAGLSS